jgi:hypothetical protein
MGNYMSNQSNLHQQQLLQLQERLEKIEKIDLNGDGVISKNEFEKWKNDGLQEIKKSIKNEVKSEYENQVSNLNNTVDSLSKEIETLRATNKELEDILKDKNTLIQRLGANIDSDEDVQELVSMLSRDQINMYVEDLLADEETNIKYLPDVVERQIYRNIFRLAIKVLNKMMGSMSFEMVNHKMKINMIPNIDVNNVDV